MCVFISYRTDLGNSNWGIGLFSVEGIVFGTVVGGLVSLTAGIVEAISVSLWVTGLVMRIVVDTLFSLIV